MFNEWKRELNLKKQRTIGSLLDDEELPSNVITRGKFKRAIYYTLFDRNVLKNKVKQKTFNHPKLYHAIVKGYSGMKKAKRGVKIIIGRDDK